MGITNAISKYGHTVGKKTAPMFVHFGKIGMVRNNDISRKSEKIT